MKTLSDLLKAGNDPVVIMTEIIAFFRNLLVVKSAPDMVQYLEVPMSNLDNFKRVSMLFSKEDILESLGFLNEAIEKIKKTQMAQLWLEVNMVQLCKKPKSPDTTINSIPTITNPVQVNQVSDNINNETLNKLLDKISYLENKVEELSRRSFTQTEKVYSPQQNYQENHKNENIKNNEIVRRETQNQNLDTADIWHKILKETKIKSVAAAALLIKGKLVNVDNEKKVIVVHFENEAFIDLLKASKYEKVELALMNIFGSQYKLIMEKDNGNSIETKTPNSIPSQSLPSHHIEHSQREIIKEEITNVIVETITKESIQIDDSNNIETHNDKVFHIKVEQTEEKYIIEGNNLIKSENTNIIKDVTQEEYQIDINNENTAFENEMRKQSDERYFKDVSEAFKGKIIKKTNPVI
jgi:DNA polymerase III gamma/tau subunit